MYPLTSILVVLSPLLATTWANHVPGYRIAGAVHGLQRRDHFAARYDQVWDQAHGGVDERIQRKQVQATDVASGKRGNRKRAAAASATTTSTSSSSSSSSSSKATTTSTATSSSSTTSSKTSSSTTTSASASCTALASSYNSWTAHGCLSDASPGKTLSTRVAAGDGSLQNCLDACDDANLAYCGIENGATCYGSATAPTVVAGTCNVACSGTNTCCGGATALQYFTKIPSFGAWTTAGCWSDSVFSRSLGNKITPTSCTIDGCRAAAATAGYAYAGMEAGCTCYADDSLAATSVQLLSLFCLTPCSANIFQSCGGAVSLSLSTRTVTYS